LKRETTIGFSVRSLSNLFRRCFDAEIETGNECRPTGLQGWIIGYLFEHGAVPIYQNELENAFEVRRSTMTEILNGMEKNGLIIRVRDEKDARKKKILLTDQARDFHAEVLKSVSDIENAALSGLSRQEIEAYFSTTTKIKTNLEKKLNEKGEQNHE